MQESSISKDNFEHCLKCSICNTVCPVMRHAPRYGGPKKSGPDGERYRLKNGLFYDDALKYCLNCKRCEVACPSGVRIGDLIQEAKLRYGAHRPHLREFILANTDLMGKTAGAIAPAVNFSLGLAPVKTLMDSVLGVDKRRNFPTWSPRTFEAWFKRNAQSRQADYALQISYFHGCYANYNYPSLGKDFVAVMNAFGIGMQLLPGERCCGVAKIVNGMEKSARKDGAHNLGLLRDAVRAGRDVVTVSTTCTLTLQDEYPHVLGLDNADVRDHIVLAEKFLYKLLESGTIRAVWKPDYRAKAAYHCPCHQERLGLGIFTVWLLRQIPGLELTVLDSNCCGIAGTYGFKKENFRTSQAIGEALFEQIRRENPDFVACECETCKWQIEMSTGYQVQNPISILADALDLEKTAALNKR
ncbi:MAG: anaerobic glycerol-3-phosphate dehydrogenase subunit C [Bacteroidales bacterium]|nr:anaerobic glycerol-3-phosphate dehydrogenase subunit C [Bacteroidales bacterium]